MRKTFQYLSSSVLFLHLEATQHRKRFLVPFDTGGVTEMMGLGATDDGVEDPAEPFSAPLAHGLGDCDGPTGLKQKEGKTI